MKKKPMIAFIGTDGSGKSTVIDEVSPRLLEMGFEKVHYEHLRPHWLKPLGVLLGNRSEGDEPVVNPHGKKPSGLIGSLIRLGYYAIDYTIGYFCKIAPLLRRGDTICIFDRYFYDVKIDPMRLRIKLPQIVIRGIFLMAPSPSVVLCLGGNPKILYERKPETSLEEVTRQVSQLENLVENDVKAHWVRTDQDIAQSVDDVMAIIEKELTII